MLQVGGMVYEEVAMLNEIVFKLMPSLLSNELRDNLLAVRRP